MLLRKILNDDWSEYDVHKEQGADARHFSCEDWEVDYLTSKIRKFHTWYTTDAVKGAIIVCCKTEKPPHLREHFVQCVLMYLGIAGSKMNLQTP